MTELQELKKKKLCKAVIESGGNLTQAAKKLGITQQSVSKQIHKPAVQQTIIAILNKAGATDNKIATKLVKLMDAKKLQACDVYVKEGEDGKYEINENSNDFIEVDDNQAQLKAIELLLKTKRHLDSDVPIPTPQVQVNVGEIKIMATEQLVDSLIRRLSKNG